MATQKQAQQKVDIHTTAQIHRAANFITNTIEYSGWAELKESSPQYKTTMRKIHGYLQLILMTFETLDDEQQGYIIKKIFKGAKHEDLKEFLDKASLNKNNLMNRVEAFNDFVSGNIVKEFHIPVEAVTMELSAWSQLVMEHWPEEFSNCKTLEQQVDFINSVCPFASPLKYNKDAGTVSMNTMKAGFPDIVIVDKNGVLHGEAATSAPLDDIDFESDQQERHHAVLIYINHHRKDFLKEYAQTIGTDEAKREELKTTNWKNKTMENIYNNYLGSKATTETVVENQRKLVAEMTRINTYDDAQATFSFYPAISNVIGTKIRQDRTDINDLAGALEVDVNKLRDDFTNILTYSQRFFNKADADFGFTKKFAKNPPALIYSHKSITDGVNSSYILLDIHELLNSFKPIMEKLNDISPESDEGKAISSYFNSNGQTRMLFHSFFLLDPTFNFDKWEVSLPEKSRTVISSTQQLSQLQAESNKPKDEANDWLRGLRKVNRDLRDEIEDKLDAMKDDGQSQEERDKYLIDQYKQYQKGNLIDSLEGAPANNSSLKKKSLKVN